MIIDGLLQFDPDGSALTVTRDSTNTIDLGVVRDIGATEEPLKIAVVFTTLPNSATPTTTTVQVDIATAPDNATWTVLEESAAVVIDTVTSAEPFIFRATVPEGVSRYLKLTYTVANGPLTAGAVSAALVVDRGSSAMTFYPRNYVG